MKANDGGSSKATGGLGGSLLPPGPLDNTGLQVMATGLKPKLSDRKPSPRLRVLLRGLIVYGAGTFTSECVFRNLTANGARISVDQLFQISERFYLINIRDGVAYDARVVWNKGLDIGVKFEGVMSLSADNNLMLRRLKKLWLAKAPH